MHRNYENYIKIGKEKGPTINYHDECAREWSQIFSFIHIYRKCWKIQRCAKEKKFLAFAYFLLYLWMTRHNFGIVFRHRPLTSFILLHVKIESIEIKSKQNIEQLQVYVSSPTVELDVFALFLCLSVDFKWKRICLLFCMFCITHLVRIASAH